MVFPTHSGAWSGSCFLPQFLVQNEDFRREIRGQKVKGLDRSVGRIQIIELRFSLHGSWQELWLGVGCDGNGIVYHGAGVEYQLLMDWYVIGNAITPSRWGSVLYSQMWRFLDCRRPSIACWNWIKGKVRYLCPHMMRRGWGTGSVGRSGNNRRRGGWFESGWELVSEGVDKGRLRSTILMPMSWILAYVESIETMMVEITSIEFQVVWNKRFPSIKGIDQADIVLLIVPRACPISTINSLSEKRSKKKGWFSIDG